VILLCCTRPDSPLCALCSDAGEDVKKTIVPLDDDDDDLHGDHTI
jgi:hypothetical protein